MLCTESSSLLAPVHPFGCAGMTRPPSALSSAPHAWSTRDPSPAPLPVSLLSSPRTVYGMMGTMFIQQGSLMERNIPIPFTIYTVYIPSASMALFNTGGCPQRRGQGSMAGSHSFREASGRFEAHPLVCVPTGLTRRTEKVPTGLTHDSSACALSSIQAQGSSGSILLSSHWRPC